MLSISESKTKSLSWSRFLYVEPTRAKLYANCCLQYLDPARGVGLCIVEVRTEIHRDSLHKPSFRLSMSWHSPFAFGSRQTPLRSSRKTLPRLVSCLGFVGLARSTIECQRASCGADAYGNHVKGLTWFNYKRPFGYSIGAVSAACYCTCTLVVQDTTCASLYVVLRERAGHCSACAQAWFLSAQLCTVFF